MIQYQVINGGTAGKLDAIFDDLMRLTGGDPVKLLRAIEYLLRKGIEILPSRRLSEHDRDFLQKVAGYREFTTLRDDEFTIPKLKETRKKPEARKARRKDQAAPGDDRLVTKDAA